MYEAVPAAGGVNGGGMAVGAGSTRIVQQGFQVLCFDGVYAAYVS